ncbi:uncharacterized protein LOC143912036 [Arctopsyche grandis]|uniref:uncharacterized protein LOC143912036 n=1 Tax=Arctopsyche grandis TaxID=121162 RepID=UPI00406DA42B
MAAESRLSNRYKKKWSESETVRFVEQYEMQEVLWNVRLSQYKNKEARAAAVNQIIQNSDIPGMSAEGVLKKINNIRSTYQQEKSKMQKSIDSGVPAENIYIPSLPWFHIADRFLPSVIKTRKSFINLSDIKEERANEDTSSNEAIPSSDLPPTLSPYVPPPSPDIPPYDDTSMPSSQYTMKSKRFKTSATPQHIEEAMNTLKSLKEKVDTHREIEDEFTYFGKNVACQLRQLPIMDALDCQSQILLLLQQKRKMNSIRENNRVSENLVQYAVSPGPSGTHLSSYAQEQIHYQEIPIIVQQSAE